MPKKLTESPQLRTLFALADRWGEPDPTKLAAMPANILTYWEAYFALLKEEGKPPLAAPQSSAAPSAVARDDDFENCLRVLGNG
ncbi:hypothetical protein DMT39_18885 [Klebsiella variicola]|nr:hypothetical protein DMT39_18885 [Klebsiella variicola]